MKFLHILISFSICLYNFPSVNPSRILAIFNVPSQSHAILGYELFKELVKRGHEVTVISTHPLKNPPANYENIWINSMDVGKMDEKMDRLFEETDINPALMMRDMLNSTNAMTNYTINHPDVQKLLKSDKKFDLVISEVFLNDAFLGFSSYYKCPHIVISTVGATSWVNRLTGNVAPYSTVPHVFLSFTDQMTLLQRVANVAFSIIEDTLMDIFFYPVQKEIYNSQFPNPKPTFEERMKHGVSLVLLNSHFSLSFPRPLLPNLIEVGGMHIKKTTDPLPEDFLTFIESAKEGIVYFSMGGNLKPSKMGQKEKDAIISGLSKLKQKVIWKWDDETVDVDKHKFLVRKWMPQDSILAHPNVKLFVTHGGLLGTTEAIYNSVPVVAIPVFGDQKLNSARAELAGYGVTVEYKNLTETSFSWALNEVLYNKKYTENVKLVSKRFLDKPQHPLDLATFWVEYVIRHNGAPHLHSSAQYLNSIQLHSWDAFAILFAGIVLVLLVIPYMAIKIIKKLICGDKKSVDKKLKRN